MTADPIKEWIEAFPSTAARGRLAALERERDEIDVQIRSLERLLELLPSANGSEAHPTPPATSTNGNGHPKGMGAVEIVLGENPSRVWARRDLNLELVSRGWLAEGEAGRKTLGSLLHRMVKSGRVARVGEGRYRLPSRERQEVMAA